VFEKRNIFIIDSDIDTAPPPEHREIVAYEYLIDSDPGQGNGIISTVSNTDLLEIEVDVDVSGLDVGYHVVSIRVKDTKGRWSIAKSRNIFVLPEPVTDPGAGVERQLTQYEYFFDSDPGLGNGTIVDISDATSFDQVIEVDISALDEGYHSINTRYMNDDGRWSVALTRKFYILKSISAVVERKLAHLEYFIGTDPGPGNGTSIDLGSSLNIYDELVMVDLGSENLADGDYTISFRAKDTEGVWSTFRTEAFTVCATAAAYYMDYDGDGYGNIDSVRYECVAPDGYVTDNQDCNDSIPEVTVSAVTWYLDIDNDGYGDPNDVIVDCARPEGYILMGEDCNDTDSLQNPLTVWYLDADGDGYGVDTVSVEGCEQPAGYAYEPGDCNDADPTVLLARWYYDNDGDGFGNPDDFLDACEEQYGYVLNGDDCDDYDGTIGAEIVWYIDNDGDGSGDSTSQVIACIQPAGYVSSALDCDDTDETVGDSPAWYFDADKDGFGGDSTLYTCGIAPEEFVTLGGDCNDMDSLINPLTRWFRDYDEDGFGSLGDDYTGCIPPSGHFYVMDSVDCNDYDSLSHPGAIAQPDGEDNDCDGNVDLAVQVLTFDPVDDQLDGGEPIVISAISTSELEVRFIASGPISQNGDTLTLLEAGTVTVKAYQDGDYRYLPADTVTQEFCINPVPEVEVDINLAVLESSYKTGNQWLISGAEIPGAVDSSYVAEETGNYSVKVTIDGCSGVSVEKAVSLNLGNVLPLSVTVEYPGKYYSGDTVISIIPTEGVHPYNVEFKYRKLDEPELNTINRVINLNDKFEFTINAEEIGELGFVFSGKVTDRGGNGKEIVEKYIHKAYENDGSPNIPRLSFGGKIGDYRIISIPYRLDENAVSSVFEELYPLNAENWRLIRWNPDGSWRQASHEQITRIEPGAGYFFNAVKEVSISVGAGHTVEAPFSMTLEAGWNQIGNPYTIPISWLSVLQQNNVEASVRQIRFFEPSIAGYVVFNSNT